MCTRALRVRGTGPGNRPGMLATIIGHELYAGAGA